MGGDVFLTKERLLIAGLHSVSSVLECARAQLYESQPGRPPVALAIRNGLGTDGAASTGRNKRLGRSIADRNPRMPCGDLVETECTGVQFTTHGLSHGQSESSMR